MNLFMNDSNSNLFNSTNNGDSYEELMEISIKIYISIIVVLGK